MRCLRIYATADGESHFGEVDIAMTITRLFPNEDAFELSAYYPASSVRFVHIPAGVREELKKMGYTITQRNAIGRFEVIRATGNTIEAVGDSRGDDTAVGY